VWVDYDHDYDLDLLLVGSASALMRNNGDGSWTAATSSFPFVAGEAVDAAVLEVGDSTNSFDVVVAYQNQPAVLYRDRKAGKYEAMPLGFQLAAGLQVGDFNQDGRLDLAAGSQLVENQRGVLKQGPGFPASAGVFADFYNRGRADLLAGADLFLHRGGFQYGPGKVRGAQPATAIAAADFNDDGLTDVAVLDGEGAVYFLKNATATKNPWIRIALAGVKNLKLGAATRVEVKAGRLYQKKVYQGVPLVFGLPGYTQADTVRITWPNGLIQNEPSQRAAAHYNYTAAPRLSGSCPMIFTFNGERFEFISDVLGVAPLGVFFPLDHDEYIQAPGRSLAARDGMYEVRITEELREVSYLDQIKLIAVDHPAGVEIFTSEKFKSPPFPEFRLYGVERRIYPSRAVDHQGRDVLDRVLRRDRRYPGGFQRDLNGRAETHALTLTFPSRDREGAVLYLHGWVDWADGSTFVAASQGRNALRGPSLQIRGEDGRWVTAIEDMGMPAGKPKTIAVELAGITAREFRIVTNMCVYWDEIFLGESAQEPEARLTHLVPATADLRFRGFSAVTVHPQRRQPEYFDYAQVRPTAMWNPTPGYYTRYGDTRALLESIDDRFVIMGSGDELRLLFSAGGLPALPAGWTRDFLIFVDGWAKDADANTATGATVDPLPFHAMRGYPDAGAEHPQPGQQGLHTRPALRLIRPLNGAGPRPAPGG
jgi:hypothetical protein